MEQENEFKETEALPQSSAQAEAPVRVRMPRKGQLIGVIIQRLGGNRMDVKATDSKSRNCRVPGKFKRKFWLRPKDVVMIEPWPDDDDKGDVVYKYNSSETNQLRKKGILSQIKTDF